MSVVFDPVPPLSWSGPTNGPVGSLEAVVAVLRSAADPSAPLQSPRLVAFGCDHGIAAAEVSAHPVTTTRLRLQALELGTGPAAEAAAQAGAAITTVDLTTESGDWTASGRIDREDALTEGDLDRALTAGRDAADAAIDAGADLLIGTCVSVGVSTPAAVLTAAVTRMEPVDATTRGSGIDDAAWIRKAAAVRDALVRTSRGGGDVRSLLRIGGGADIAALTGFFAQAAVRRTPVLIDDVVSTLAAILAQRLAPGADAYLIAAARSQERSHTRLLDVLGREPITAWQFRAGSGFGALLLVPVLRMASVRAEPEAEPEPRTAQAVDDWDPHLL